MLRICFTTAFLLALLLKSIIAQPFPSQSPSASLQTPTSPKSPASYHKGMMIQHVKNAGHASQEMEKAVLGFAGGGMMGAVVLTGGAADKIHLGHYREGAKEMAKAAVRPAIGAAAGLTIAGLHAARVGANAVCAAGHACGYVKHRAKTITTQGEQNFAENRANGVRLATFKRKSSEFNEEIAHKRRLATIALAGIPRPD